MKKPKVHVRRRRNVVRIVLTVNVAAPELVRDVERAARRGLLSALQDYDALFSQAQPEDGRADE